MDNYGRLSLRIEKMFGSDRCEASSEGCGGRGVKLLVYLIVWEVYWRFDSKMCIWVRPLIYLTINLTHMFCATIIWDLLVINVFILLFFRTPRLLVDETIIFVQEKVHAHTGILFRHLWLQCHHFFLIFTDWIISWRHSWR